MNDILWWRIVLNHFYTTESITIYYRDIFWNSMSVILHLKALQLFDRTPVVAITWKSERSDDQESARKGENINFSKRKDRRSGLRRLFLLAAEWDIHGEMEFGSAGRITALDGYCALCCISAQLL